MPDNSLNSPPATNIPDVAAKVAARLRNFLIVLAAIVLSVALFFGLNTQTPTSSLTQLAENSTPFDVALTNEKPTLLEFYANWCTSCQAMAPEMVKIKEKYQDSLNFAMLNVDNTKWLPEILKYRVDGIPHFVFFNPQGNAIAETIGEVPRPILEANLEALIAGNSLPYANTTGQVSAFNPPVSPPKSSSTDPRSHGSQVK